MAYTLQVLIAAPKVLERTGLAPNHFVPLTPALGLCPLTEPLRDALGVGFLPLTDGEILPASFSARLASASVGGKLAYIEAEYFGGIGTQASVLYADGRESGEPMASPDAINQALRFLGVIAADGNDEFETAGLNAHRNTETW